MKRHQIVYLTIGDEIDKVREGITSLVQFTMVVVYIHCDIIHNCNVLMSIL